MTSKLLTIATLGVVLFFGTEINAQSVKLSSDLHCLANAIYHEAGGESLKGQYAVGEVIMNRFYQGRASSVCGVVYEHHGKHWQFGFNQTKTHPLPDARSAYFFEVAQQVLNRTDNVVLPPNVLYFNNKPFDAHKYKLYCQIGKQRFYIKRDSYSN